jgi:hypothetical protein
MIDRCEIQHDIVTTIQECHASHEQARNQEGAHQSTSYTRHTRRSIHIIPDHTYHTHHTRRSTSYTHIWQCPPPVTHQIQQSPHGSGLHRAWRESTPVLIQTHNPRPKHRSPYTQRRRRAPRTRWSWSCHCRSFRSSTGKSLECRLPVCQQGVMCQTMS